MLGQFCKQWPDAIPIGQTSTSTSASQDDKDKNFVFSNRVFEKEMRKSDERPLYNYIIEGKFDEAQEIDRFNSLFELNWDFLFFF